MKAQAFLEQLETLDTIIGNKLAEREHWRSIALGITGSTEGERVQSSGSQQKMADAIDRYVDIGKEIDETIDRLTDKKLEVIRLLDKLAFVNRRHYDILHKMYVGHVVTKPDGTFATIRMDFTDYANLYGKSYSWATTVHGRALQNFQRILDAEYPASCD